MAFDRDFRPRVDEITEQKINMLAHAWGKKPNVLLREFIVAATDMVEFVQRHPEVLGDFNWNEISPNSLLWRASESKAALKSKVTSANSEAA